MIKEKLLKNKFGYYIYFFILYNISGEYRRQVSRRNKNNYKTYFIIVGRLESTLPPAFCVLEYTLLLRICVQPLLVI